MLTLAAVAACAFGGQTSGMAFRSFTVEGRTVQGPIRGPWEWTGGVTVRGSGITVTADSLKLWPSPDGRDADRIEANGNVRVEGRYVQADQSWEFTGKAAVATYERASSEGVMRGSVTFHATNSVTGAAVSAAADKMIYSFKTRHFRFERGDKPVHMEWQEPAPAAPAAPAAPKVGAAK
jgi:lipopolysaccharide export system protein LptA